MTIEKIREKVNPLAKKYGILSIELFGSYANGNANEASDIDLLVRFSESVPSIFKVMGFREEAQLNLQKSVDVVTMPITNAKYLKIQKTVNVYEA